MTSARLIDLTRMTTRVGRVRTGVDRVERAYAQAILEDVAPSYGLVRTAIGYLLLDEVGMSGLLEALDKGLDGKPDLVSRLNWRLSEAARAGQSLARQFASYRCTRSRLSHILKAQLPSGFHYFNVGHSALTRSGLNSVRGAGAGCITVMIHDTIPLSFPKLQRDGTPESFAKKLNSALELADYIVCPTEAAAGDVRAFAKKVTTSGKVVAAHLGVEIEAAPIQPASAPDGPFFVTVGTIEPRKNHQLLLDIWAADHETLPPLYICGVRGWKNETVFDALDQKPVGVMERPDLNDGEIRWMMQNATAFLFPSLAEGFGIPPVEALSLGTPVLCSDIPVLHEVMGESAVYLDPTDPYLWKTKIEGLAAASGKSSARAFKPPTWSAHFDTVFALE